MKDSIGITTHGFCERDIETAERIFFQCEPVEEFWMLFESWLQSKKIQLHPLSMMSIKNGVLLKKKNRNLLINNLIHRCKYLKVKPHINGWKNELKLSAKPLQCMTSRNALSLFSLLDLYLLLE